MAARAPANARLTHMDIADRTRAEFVADIAATLREEHPTPFDIIVIDSWESRSSYAGIARDMLAEDGAIICDNSDGYRIFEAFRESGLSRLDFHGIAPGTSIPTVTSIYFRGRCFLFDNTQPIGREPR